jgi:hypothetical protein
MAFRQLVVGRQQALVHRAAFHVRPQGGEPEEALASIEQGFGLAHGLRARLPPSRQRSWRQPRKNLQDPL